MAKMTAQSDEKKIWDLPHLRETLELAAKPSEDVFDVKFYPFDKTGSDPIFAVVRGRQVLVCRPSHTKTETTKVIQVVENEDPKIAYACVAWSKHRITKHPLLCVAGNNGVITVIDALTGEEIQSLTGHGGGINHLAISPINSQILASASEDCTITICSLDPAHEQQPLAVLLAGEGHGDQILSVAFHATGRYLLSGGNDHVVNLWTLPDLQKGAHPEKPIVTHYPHFSTSDIHDNIVDCVAFHKDLILSKAFEEDTIVLWSITNFDSSRPPPSSSAVHTNYDQSHTTRSSFSPLPTSPSSPLPPLYQRLLTFEIPGCESWFVRFSLYNPLSAYQGHPVLAIANSSSKVHFWDFGRLQQWHEYRSSSLSKPRPSWLNRGRSGMNQGLGRAARASSVGSSVNTLSTEQLNSTTDATPVTTGADMETIMAQLDEGSRRKYNIDDPNAKIKAHKVESIRTHSFTGRQVAWSPAGDWCVVVGSADMVAVLERWGTK